MQQTPPIVAQSHPRQSIRGVNTITRFNRFVAATLAATVLTLTATAPANAIVDKDGNLVGVIITADGEEYY